MIYNELEKLWQKKIADFFRRYPYPELAWIERQDVYYENKKRDHNLWIFNRLKNVIPTRQIFMILKPPSRRHLIQYWYRAALELCDHKILTDENLAGVFGLDRSTYQGLVVKEKAWRKNDSMPQPPPTPLWSKERKNYEESINRALIF